MHTGPAAHLLPETGGPGPPSTHSGENLYGYSAILKRLKHKCVICRKERQQAPKVKIYHWTLLVNLHIKQTCVPRRQMSNNVQETIIFLTLRLKAEYGTYVSTA